MSKGHGKLQRLILEVLADGPATSRMIYDECWVHDERAVRRSLDRLWDEDVIRQQTAKLEHGVPVWSLSDDEREFDPERVLPLTNARQWIRIRALMAVEGWEENERVLDTLDRTIEWMTGDERAVALLMRHEYLPEEFSREVLEMHHRGELPE